MYDKILLKANADKTLSTIIQKSRKNKFKKTLFFIAVPFGTLILSGILFKFKPISWIITISLLLFISAFIVYFYNFPKRTFIIGKIQRIDHDYSMRTTKGTGGFGLKAGVYTTIKNQHILDIKLLSSGNPSQKIHSVICPPQYERVLKCGDTILYHPYLKYPATLSNKSKCICMKCGTMQSIDNSACFECKTTLFNFNTLSQ